MDEYSSEKFIEQYEHIKRLELLKDDELKQLKRKRAQFEVSIKSTNEVKQFIEYIRYEMALMKKFKQIEHDNVNDGRALDRAIAIHIRGIYSQAVRRFSNNRKLWSSFLDFVKLKFPNSVSNTYQEMLAFHHTKEDYIEAVEHEMKNQNYLVAINFLIQGLNKEKDSKDLIVLHIECSLLQAENITNERHKEKTLEQVSKFYEKFIKGSDDVGIYINLLKKIQHIKCSHHFQNEIVNYILKVFPSRPEVWDVVANRHLDGLFIDEVDNRQPDEILFEERLRKALAIYNHSLQVIDSIHKQEMYEKYLTKLEDLDSLLDLSNNCYKFIRGAFIIAIISGFKQNCLSESRFIQYFKLRMVNKEKYHAEIKEILEKGEKLHKTSMYFYELAFNYHYEMKDDKSLSNLFKYAVHHNENRVIELYKLLWSFLINPEDKDQVRNLLMNAIESNDKKLSAYFQPYILEYYAATESITKTREMYNRILDSKNVVTLSLDFFNMMIKLEKNYQLDPDCDIIRNCFERAIKLFGSSNPEIWIEYIKICWDNGKFSEANSLKTRAIDAMKGNLKNVESFELKFTLARNNV